MKQGQYHDITSWRPIASLECSYKIFVSALTLQLSSWLNQNNLLHPMQKSLGPFNGCSEHIFLLRDLIDQYRRKLHMPLHIAFLDVADAFGSIDIYFITGCLRRMGVGSKSCSLIEALYSNCQSYFMCGSFTTEPIPINVGVRQGCPLSMLLFNVGMNPILNSLDQVLCGGVLVREHRLSALAYEDDVVLLATSRPHMQKLLDRAVQVSSWLHLEFRPSKCAHIRVPQVNNCYQLTINDSTIATLSVDKTYRYLGVDFCENLHSPPVKLFGEIIDQLRTLSESVLYPWQKLNAYHVFIHSRMIFAFRNNYITFNDLTQGPNAIEPTVRRILKGILGLGNHSSIKYMYTPKCFGGAGLISIVDEYLIQSITNVFQLLNSPDSIIRDVAIASLISASSDFSLTKTLSIDEAFEWLNRGDVQCLQNCWWKKTRSAINQMFSRHKITIKFVNNDKGICLKLHQHLDNNYQNESLVMPENAKVISKLLHNLVNHSWNYNWNSQASAGRFASSIGQSSLSTSPIFKGEISISAWFFIHRARSYSIQINARHGSHFRGCRRCKEPEETLSHVLVDCNPSKLFLNCRHNSIQDHLAEKIKENTKAKVYINAESQYINSTKRVDLQIEFTNRKVLYLIDVKCPYDTENNMFWNHEKNLLHYADLLQNTKNALPEWTIILETFAVGCLGSWPKRNEKILKSLEFKKPMIKGIAKFCVASNIKWSAAQWNFHRDVGKISINISELYDCQGEEDDNADDQILNDCDGEL